MSLSILISRNNLPSKGLSMKNLKHLRLEELNSSKANLALNATFHLPSCSNDPHYRILFSKIVTTKANSEDSFSIFSRRYFLHLDSTIFFRNFEKFKEIEIQACAQVSRRIFIFHFTFRKRYFQEFQVILYNYVTVFAYYAIFFCLS